MTESSASVARFVSECIVPSADEDLDRTDIGEAFRLWRIGKDVKGVDMAEFNHCLDELLGKPDVRYGNRVYVGVMFKTKHSNP